MSVLWEEENKVIVIKKVAPRCGNPYCPICNPEQERIGKLYKEYLKLNKPWLWGEEDSDVKDSM